MLSWFRRFVSGQSNGVKRHPWRVNNRIVRARYDAAANTEDNRRHWANADTLSPNEANSPEVRRTLRARARYEIANNCYAYGMTMAFANDLIGTGPKLQLLTEDQEFNRRIEREFAFWAKSISLAQKLRTMRIAKSQDGEAFAILGNNPRLPTPVQLDIRLVEADLVTTPDLEQQTDTAVDGIVFDSFGNPIEYHVLREHPGSSLVTWNMKYDRVPAQQIIHWFRLMRPGQARGIPEITPALPLFAQLRRYTLAVLAAAETAATFAGILYTDAPAGGEAEETPAFEPIELEMRALVTMPEGWKMEQLRAEQPTTKHADFVRALLTEAARCYLMPYNVASGDSSNHNYASGRLDHQVYFRALRIEQSHLEDVVLDRLLAEWLKEAALIPGMVPERFAMIANVPHQWFWDGPEHVDPLKEANAQAVRLASHTTTLAYEYARQGRDWEAALEQRAKEIALMRKLGLLDTTGQAQQEQDDDERNIDEAT